MSDQFTDAMHEAARVVYEIVEADLRALGVTIDSPPEVLTEYSIIWQQTYDRDGFCAQSVYRGIARNGKLIWDKHPEWEPVKL